MGYSPWGGKELETTEQLSLSLCIILVLLCFILVKLALGGFLVAQVKAPVCNVGDPSSIPGSGRSPREGNGNPLQYSCLENSTDGGAWKVTVRGAAKNRTRLRDLTFFLSIVPFGEGNGNPLQCSCLENPMDRWVWWATVYGVAKSPTRLSNSHTHTHTH